MRRFWKQLLFVPVLAAAVLAGCEAGNRPTPLAPSGQPEEILGLLNGARVEGYTLVREPILSGLTSSLRVSEIIGIQGGQVTLLGHTLLVPPGAVSQPTLFSLVVLPTGYVEVELGAILNSVLGLVLDVGSKGFAKPVPVTLTYSRATNVAQPGKLQVVRINSLLGYRNLQPLPSRVDTVEKTVTADLEHFSRYVLAWP